MESDDEILRLELKTVAKVVETQALWAGLKEGMHIADIGCGSGKTTAILNSLVQPDGMAVGIDGSEKRINHAKEKYAWQ
jgi:ubiquinone/menaquinone biosynthesis C-methylase UbiE